MDAEQFISRLKSYQSDKEFKKIIRYFNVDEKDNRVIGVRMKKIFDLAKENTDMPLKEVEKLLNCPYYEGRMGGVSIMDFQARRKSTTKDRRKELYDLYLNNHDRINSWDFVDRSAPHVIGGYLYEFGQTRGILYKLAKSDNLWERRTAIVSTGYFLRKGELDDTFAIAKILLNDDHDLIHKAVGTWIRHAGKQDQQKLLRFLEKYAAKMPGIMLTYAMEKLDKEQKAHFRKLKH